MATRVVVKARGFRTLELAPTACSGKSAKLDAPLEALPARVANADYVTSFYQVDSSSTREYGGAGLGLAIVKSFVEGHGGVVRVASEIGHGSRFTLVLPVTPSSQQQVLITPPVTSVGPADDRF